MVETGIVAGLLLGYLSLWRMARQRGVRRSGIDPEVLQAARTPVQQYFAHLTILLTSLVVGIIGLHAFAPPTWPPLVRIPGLNSLSYDVAGGLLGLTGLATCAVAQATMGGSWRVGLDTEHPTALVTSGIYKLVRNPTSLGLHLVNLGLWLVWPTTLVSSYLVLFFVVMDIQVRAEEEHLLLTHGDAYRGYMGRTYRYLPMLY